MPLSSSDEGLGVHKTTCIVISTNVNAELLLKCQLLFKNELPKPEFLVPR